MNTQARRRAYSRGHMAEVLALWWLRFKGYRIVARRWRSHYGEIDLIALRGDCCVFIEVKARRLTHESLEAIHARQRMRVERSAQAFLQKHPRYACSSMRFDVIACAPWRLPRHFPDAWRPPA